MYAVTWQIHCDDIVVPIPIVDFFKVLMFCKCLIFSLFSQFYFHEWYSLKLTWAIMLKVLYGFGQYFQGLKFHKSVKSLKFAGFNYFKKTNHTVIKH